MRIGLFLVMVLVAWGNNYNHPNPTIILRKWKAKTYPFEGLKIPLAPNIEVTRNELVLLNPDGMPFQRFQLSAIKAEGDEIDLELSGFAGVALAFKVENSERIHFRVPIIGSDIAFDKLK